MIKNYLKIAFRNLAKNKAYTIINALGLSIGIGSCLFILVLTQLELSFDNYHLNRERIYRLTDVIQVSSDRTLHTASSPAPWGPAMRKDYPEIENYVRYLIRGHVVRNKDNLINETIVYTDPGVFEVFTYPLIKGNPKTALTQPYSLVLTTEMAEKYFGDDDPMGKTLTFDNKQQFVITGVMNKVPANSYFTFNFLASFASLNEQNFEAVNDWRSHWCHTYFLLSDDASPAEIEQRFPDFIHKYIEEQYQERYRPQLQPFTDLHLHSDLGSEWGDTLDIAYLYIFSAIAVFILLIACINFMNLATARSAKRAKEVGMRKVLGAYRPQLIRQFLTESIVISFIALFFAVIFVELAIPWFNGLTEREVSINYFENNLYLTSLFVITLVVGILSGSYPAFFLSRFQPVKVISGHLSMGLKGAGLRKTLVVAQFCIAIFMIIANFILYNQIKFLQNKDLGFDKNNIVVFGGPQNNTVERQATIKNELLQKPEIRRVALTSSEPGDGYMWGRFLPEGTSEKDGLMLKNIAIDDEYFSLLNIELIAGRNFSKNIASDTSDAIIINETAAQQFGWDDPVGKRIDWLNNEAGTKSYTVIGVATDFHFEPLHESIQPLIIHKSPAYLNSYLIRLESLDKAATVKDLEAQWKLYDPDNPTFHYFLDDDLALEYRFEQIIGSLLIKFTILTIFIACLGLLGLSSFTAEQRTKEIGIRKVLGASLQNIITMLSSEFMKLVLLANIIAWPLAYFGMKAWLQNFAYHIEIGLWIFLVCGAIALAIAWLTICYQAIKAALANPVKSLRYE